MSSEEKTDQVTAKRRSELRHRLVEEVLRVNLPGTSGTAVSKAESAVAAAGVLEAYIVGE